VPAWLLDLFAKYGYAVVFVGVFLENTGLPVPGETMLLAGAALAHAGRLAFGWVIVSAIGGATLGDNLGFFIGRHGGRLLAVRYGSAIGVTEQRLAEFDRFFVRHGGGTVFVARFITGLRVVGAVLAGASGLAWSTFLFYNAAGAVAWSLVIGAVGYVLAYSWDRVVRLVGGAGMAALVAFIALVVFGMLRARRRDKA
jgi:membrane protein DedA with SNARE-associated domain